MNKERLALVRDAILKAPDHFYMGHWISYLSDPHAETLYFRPIVHGDLQECGTTACIAGWAVALSEGTTYLQDRSVNFRAREWLELTLDEASRLFYVDESSIWTEVADRFGWKTVQNSVDPVDQITAEQAAEVIYDILNGELTLVYGDA